jgi:hypothetical protein
VANEALGWSSSMIPIMTGADQTKLKAGLLLPPVPTHMITMAAPLTTPIVAYSSLPARRPSRGSSTAAGR